MKNIKHLISFTAGAIVCLGVLSFKDNLPLGKYILQHEKDIEKIQPGPHKGGGETIAYPFFEGTPELKMAFRKRVLKPGSAIGYHLQETDEIYYVLDGVGEMQMNGNHFPVKKGDAVLTRPGSSHGIKQLGNKDLTIIISYLLHRSPVE